MAMKSQTYPETTPPQFASVDKLADAYKRGWSHGHGFACHNVPTLGETYWTDGEGRQTADRDNVREVHASLCYTAESNSRSFSPFEFTAHEFNSAGYDGDGEEHNEGEPVAEELWEAFDAGISDAISADLATYEDADYGIEEEEDALVFDDKEEPEQGAKESTSGPLALPYVANGEA